MYFNEHSFISMHNLKNVSNEKKCCQFDIMTENLSNKM